LIHDENATIGGRSLGQKMPLIYRAMKKEGERPKTGRTATSLGVKIPEDIAVDEKGWVSPSTGGMSVAPAWRLLASHRIPARLKHLCRDAAGSNNVHCWKMGEGEFVDGSLTSALKFRRDTAIHGLVEPTATVPLETYEANLTATREHWMIDEV
jgi:hypothetical protein